MLVSRRSLLAGGASLAAAAILPRHAFAGTQTLLTIDTRQIDVGGKSATRYGVSQPDGTRGLFLNEGEAFDVRLENRLAVPSGLHWHGLNPPWRQDGVPYLSGPPVAPSGFAEYRFPATPTGTRWMHSHFGLQEQDLLAAPLIIREASAAASGIQEVVILLEDFSFTPADELFAALRKGSGAMNMSGDAMGGSHAGMDMETGGGMDMSKPDLNDITYDAYLANDRTLDDPEVVDVERNAKVRLRIINGGASTNFTIDLGRAEGTLVAVDGNAIVPIKASRFPLGISQRADILVDVPDDGAPMPVLALGEGRKLRAGVILRPPGATIAAIPVAAEDEGPVVDLSQEPLLTPTNPLAAKPVDRSVAVDLTGTMAGYIWGMSIDGMSGMPVMVAKGERVELVMRNLTMMSHPMHLHGHSFQVTEINGKPLNGAIRDGIIVPPMTTVTVAFDADNPGVWAFHCHNLYHMAAGMFATVAYDGFS